MYTHLADGEKCEGRALEALVAEMERRLTRAELAQRPDLPRFTDLRLRKSGLPEWWLAGNNVFLAAPGVATPKLQTAFFGHGAATNAILVMGQHASIGEVNLGDHAAMVATGDRVTMFLSTITVVTGGTVLVGEDTTVVRADVEARNEGLVAVGADGMWSLGVHVMTDDMHAIRDLATGQRINRRGGKIVIEPHVWLGMDVRVLGDSYIGKDSVVGVYSLVRNMTLPPNAISAGTPARVVRTGITWNREDLP